MIAILGATGYTGELVIERARSAGLPLRLVGRRADALAAVARSGDDVRVADARDGDALRAAFDGTAVVVSLAGPFLENGDAPVRAAIDVGAHYVDTSGEQAFARLVYERHDAGARDRNVAVLTSFGFDYVPGDLAARLAAEGLEPLDEIVVGYSTRRFGPSAGTRRTIGHVMQQPQVAYSGRSLVPSAFGATTRRIRFPFGERSAVEWGGTEPLTVPRHTDVANVRSYLRAPGIAARGAALGRLFAPVVRATAVVGRGPSAKRRMRAEWTVAAEASGASGRRNVALTGRDVYGLTAALVVEAARALSAGEVRESGALAPAQAFDARALVERLEQWIDVPADPGG